MTTKFETGQVWKYKTRTGENESRITIVHVDYDDHEYGDIVHIFISDLDIPNANAPEGKTIFIGHLPFESKALADSVTELESETEELPDFDSGYQLWREAFDNSEAGVFNVAVSEAIDFVQQSVA